MFLGPPPTPPRAGKPVRFPLLALMAPVALSVVMAMVMQSALALIMGVLGPLMVVGGWWHQRRSAATERDEAEEHHALALNDYERALDAERTHERVRQTVALPSVVDWSTDPLWRQPVNPPSLVRVGQGWWEPPSGHPLFGTAPVMGMPVAVDVGGGIAVVGGGGAADVWRNIVLQWWIASGAGGLEPPLSDSGEAFPTDIRGVSRAVWVGTGAVIPPECQTVLVVGSDPIGAVHVQGEPARRVKCDRLTHAQALRALRLRVPPVHPEESRPHDRDPRRALWAQLSPDAPLVDIVREGPHTVTWGATGSGKSQTVCSFVLSLAREYSPRDLICVVVDFKGGAGLRPLAALPHTVGMVTDLDPLRSTRARAGLQAEMVRRETIMESHGVSDVSDLPSHVVCPRLLVVVDEVAWLCSNHPDWAETLADLAQRGRSLGIHLILSTQRISGVLSRALMANVSLRICGRVSDDLEVSEWMPDLSTPQKNSLRHVSPGRVVVAGAISTPTWHSVTPTSEHHAPIRGQKTQWRVWSEDLPTLRAPTPGVWGWVDQPNRQTHDECSEDPLQDGSLVIIGDKASGKTSTSFAIAAQSTNCVLAPQDPAGLWACLQQHHARQVSIVIDDADQILHAAGSEGEVFLMDALEGFEGRLIMTMSPRHRLSRGLARLAPQRLVLSIAPENDQGQWGGPGQAQAGRGIFRGRVIQVTYPHASPSLWSPADYSVESDPVVITHTPSSWSGWPARFIGSPDEAMAAWSTLGSWVAETDVIFDGIAARDARMVSAGRISLPPLAPQPGWAWVWRHGKAVLARPAAREQQPQ